MQPGRVENFNASAQRRKNLNSNHELSWEFRWAERPMLTLPGKRKAFKAPTFVSINRKKLRDKGHADDNAALQDKTCDWCLVIPRICKACTHSLEENVSLSSICQAFALAHTCIIDICLEVVVFNTGCLCVGHAQGQITLQEARYCQNDDKIQKAEIELVQLSKAGLIVSSSRSHLTLCNF